MWKAAQEGNWAEVKREQDRLNEISHIFDVTTGVQGYGAGVGAFKCAHNLMGICDSDQIPRRVNPHVGQNRVAKKQVRI